MVPESAKSESAPCYNPSGSSVPNRKILLIDDEKDIHDIVRAAFKFSGDQVVSALDAMQAPMMARQVRPDVIILDINIPAGGGYKTYERLRMMSGTLEVPILIYTGVPRDQVELQIHPSANTAFLAKPAQPQEIVTAVEKLLTGGHRPGQGA